MADESCKAYSSRPAVTALFVLVILPARKRQQETDFLFIIFFVISIVSMFVCSNLILRRRLIRHLVSAAVECIRVSVQAFVCLLEDLLERDMHRKRGAGPISDSQQTGGCTW